MSLLPLGPEEEHILTSFTRRLITIAADADAHGGTSTVDVLNTMLLPAIGFVRRGFVAHVTAAADALFDDDIKIKANVFSFATLKPARF